MCIGFGAGYFAKIPAKKAAIEVTGRGQLTSAEHFWYILQCVAFGAGYFAKIPTKKALAELASAGDLEEGIDACKPAHVTTSHPHDKTLGAGFTPLQGKPGAATTRRRRRKTPSTLPNGT